MEAQLVVLRTPAPVIRDAEIDKACLTADYGRIFDIFADRLHELARFSALHRVEFSCMTEIDERKARLYVADLSIWVARIDHILFGKDTASAFPPAIRRGIRA